MFFELCQNYKSIKAIDNNMKDNFEQFVNQLEFKIIY